jgi:thioredoxin-like negative regulator of GroEL
MKEETGMDPVSGSLEEKLEVARQLARDGNIIEAGRVLRSLEKVYPESSDLQMLLGACYLKINHRKLARICLMRAIELAPANKKAKTLLERIGEKDPTNFEITEEGSGALSGDLDSCWDPTH